MSLTLVSVPTSTSGRPHRVLPDVPPFLADLCPSVTPLAITGMDSRRQSRSPPRRAVCS